MNRKRDIPLVGNILGRSLPGKMAGKLVPPGLLAAWREAAGELIAGKAGPVCLEEGGVLVVAAPGGPWKQELTLDGPELCRKLQEAGWAVQSLRLVQVRSPSPPKKPPAPPRSLEPAEEAAIAETVAKVSDPELRRALAEAMGSQLSYSPSPGK